MELIQSCIELFIENWQIFLNGTLTTLSLAAIAVLIGSVLGGIIAILQLSQSKIIAFILKIYTTVFRATPLLVQLYIAYYFLPEAIPVLKDISKEHAVLVALVLNSGAYVAEIFRSGINAVDKGQTEAARSLGMTKMHTLMKIVFPQAIKNILPALGNEYITMIKETSLASTLAVSDLMYTRNIFAGRYITIEPLFIIAAIYLIVVVVLTALLGFLEKRLSVSD